MIGDQAIESVVNGVRRGEFQLSLDQVSVNLNPTTKLLLDAPCELKRDKSGLSFTLRTTPSTILPQPLLDLLERSRTEPVSVTPADYFEIEAITAQAVPVRLSRVSPILSRQHSILSRPASTQTYSFGLEQLHFPAAGLDAMDVDQVLDEMHAGKVSAGAVPPGARAPRKSEPDEEYFAIIPGVKLKIRPDATKSSRTHPYNGESETVSYDCFIGTLAGGDFCLQDKDGDLRVYFHRLLRLSGGNLPADAVFEGILKATGFTHCVHPWPFYRQHRVDHRVVERWVKVPQQCETDGLPPMCEGRMRMATHSRYLFTKAALFFAKRDAKSEVFDRALWLLHASNPKGMAVEIRVLTLCSVLEGLVKEHAGGGVGSNPGPWMTAAGNLNLDWQGWFDNVFQSWKNYRNRLAHGFDVLPSANNPIDILHVYSRLFAAVYAVMARQMGFLGKLEESMLENRSSILLTATDSSIRRPRV